ncbi:hypothetical protein HHL23_09395 [Chryseobacterium sp. RP-3-3]|uniref:Uncharacterized protein n=1 Tax=Chryseobacterium antibioticum TaxID=2728847 RepID=A0A7Y0AMG4_9FLAO|nr:hypothetical protein [Chryseobacterium antibioticum]NML70014.1 hypothetical protein [Chryseobacterium antibioticum]
MKTKEEQLKIYSAYLPYGLKFISNRDSVDITNAWTLVGLKIDNSYPHKPTLLSERSDYKNVINIWSPTAKPILYDLSYLTKEELIKAGFNDHIDFLTHEREHWIKVYGFEKYISKLPYGHFQYLVSNHFNIFNLDESEYINKANLKQ